MARYEEPPRREPKTEYFGPTGYAETPRVTEGGARIYQTPGATEGVHEAPRGYDADLRVLMRELSDEASTFIRNEIALARAEIGDQVQKAKASSASLGIGTALVVGGTLALLCFAIALLDLALPLWLSALVVGVALLAIGGALLASGAKKLKNMNLKPERALREARTTLRMMKEEIR